MTLHCPGIVFLDIQSVQNNIGSLILLKCLYLLILKDAECW